MSELLNAIRHLDELTNEIERRNQMKLIWAMVLAMIEAITGWPLLNGEPYTAENQPNAEADCDSLPMATLDAWVLATDTFAQAAGNAG